MSFKLLIDGALVDGATSIDVIYPATGKSFATSPKADMAQAEKAIAAAKRAFPAWAAMPFAERAKRVGGFAEAIKARKDEFARLLTQEVGKPIVEAGFEVAETVDAPEFFAGQDLQPKVLRDNGDELIVEQRNPQGVVAAITPWNFPLAAVVQDRRGPGRGQHRDLEAGPDHPAHHAAAGRDRGRVLPGRRLPDPGRSERAGPAPHQPPRHCPCQLHRLDPPARRCSARQRTRSSDSPWSSAATTRRSFSTTSI